MYDEHGSPGRDKDRYQTSKSSITIERRIAGGRVKGTEPRRREERISRVGGDDAPEEEERRSESMVSCLFMGFTAVCLQGPQDRYCGRRRDIHRWGNGPSVSLHSFIPLPSSPFSLGPGEDQLQKQAEGAEGWIMMTERTMTARVPVDSFVQTFRETLNSASYASLCVIHVESLRRHLTETLPFSLLAHPRLLHAIFLLRKHGAVRLGRNKTARVTPCVTTAIKENRGSLAVPDR